MMDEMEKKEPVAWDALRAELLNLYLTHAPASDDKVAAYLNVFRRFLSQHPAPRGRVVAEEVAKIIYDAMREVQPPSVSTKPWVEHGNAISQDVARYHANRILALVDADAPEVRDEEQLLANMADADAQALGAFLKDSGFQPLPTPARADAAETSGDGLFTIEPHGAEGEFALYEGRGESFHGLNLCKLSDFDMNGEQTRRMIVDALNTTAARTRGAS